MKLQQERGGKNQTEAKKEIKRTQKKKGVGI